MDFWRKLLSALEVSYHVHPQHRHQIQVRSVLRASDKCEEGQRHNKGAGTDWY